MTTNDKLATVKITTHTNKYDALDQHILNAVAAGKNRHSQICEDANVNEHATALGRQNKTVHRIVDGRTQALRTRGLLTYTATLGWRIPNV